MGPTHRLTGVLAGVVVASLAQQTWSVVAMSGLVASATSHGWASPDLDQTKPWIRVRKALPDDLAVLLNHRNLTHWWGLPVGAWLWTGTLPVQSQWAMRMLVVGWVSHLLGDFIFGALPLLPWGGPRVGLGLDTGGFIETGVLHRRRWVPFSPARVLILVGIAWVLFAQPLGVRP
jgi:membrane-bound metal-dependent hydrolase YbcI (DUF457 family)